MDIKIIEQKPVTLSEVKKALESSNEEDQNFRITKTKEYLDYFAKLSEKEAKELKKKIEDLNIPRLKEEMIVKVVDLLPKSEEEVSLIFQAYPITISSQNLKKIASTVEEFMKNRK